MKNKITLFFCREGVSTFTITTGTPVPSFGAFHLMTKVDTSSVFVTH